MSREIMQMALRALKAAEALLPVNYKRKWIGIEAIAALEQELAKPANEFHPDWDTLKPYHDRIAELEAQLAKPEYPDLRKAAEMALDALENNLPLIEDYGSKEQLNIHHKAIAALYKTLAQPEHPLAKKADNARELGLDYEPEQYDQTTLELCDKCGWKTLIPDDCCLNCERNQVEKEKLCVNCGKPTMHIGNKCYGCCQTAQPEQEPTQAINDVIDYLYSTGADNDMANRAHIALKQLQMNLRDQTALHLLYKGDYEDLIAQPEQEPVAWHSHNPDYPIQDGDWVEVIFTSGQPDDAKKWTPLYTAPSKPEQEPVAWQVMVENEPMKEFSIKDMAHDWAVTEKLNGSKYSYWIRPLYAAPPKHEWVGLTDDEILSFVAFEPHPLMNKTSIIHAVQAKLREKNG